MSDLKKLDYYEDLAEDLFNNPDNAEEREVWEKVDKMYKSQLEIDEEIVKIVGNAKFATPLVADGIKGIKRFLGNRLPTISVMPMSPSTTEKDRMEYLEDALKWHFTLMNKRDAESTHAKITDSAARYGAIAFQTRYIPFEKKRKDNKGKDLYDSYTQKEMSHYGDFDFPVHHPANVYPVWSNGVLTSATAMFTRTVWDVVREYGEDSPAVKELLKRIRSDDGELSPADMRSNWVSFFDHTGCYDRVIWMSLNGSSSTLETGGDPIEIVRAERKQGFVNWVIKNNGEPIMGSIVNAGTYDHLGQITAIGYSKWLQYAEEINDSYNTNNPNNPNINNADGVLGAAEILDNQTKHTRLPPTPPDPAILTMMGQLASELTTSMGVMPLLNLSQAASSTQGNFSSMNAIQGTAVVQLTPVKSLIERAWEEGLHQMCRWIYDSKEPSVGYRSKDKGDITSRMAGMPIVIAGNNTEIGQFENAVTFHPLDIFITVELHPDSVQDKQAAAALALQQQQAGYSRATSLEAAGVDNVELELSQRAEEMLFEAKIKGDTDRIMADAQAEVIVQNAQRMAQKILQEAQMQVQQQQMQAQQQAQQPPQGQPQQPPMTPENQARANRNPQSPQQGQDTRFAGKTPAEQGAPNRVQANGRSDAGQAMA